MKQQIRLLALVLSSLILLVACSGEQAPEKNTASATPAADLVFTNGYIYTVDAERTVAQALVVRAGKILHVGSNESAQEYAGAGTKIHDLGGRMMLPGLHDMHVHATGLAEPSLCNLEGEMKPMEELVPFLKNCLERERLPAGEWLVVVGWASGNEPSERYRNMRTALDAVSDTHPIVLWSSHSAAFNSAAFAQARDLEGRVVGMNRETLPMVYADYQEMVSVDETGEPTGKVVEDARDFIRDTVFEDLMGLNEREDYAMPAVARILAQSGITSIQDPMSVARTLEMYDWLEQSSAMSFRVRAHFYGQPHASVYSSDPDVIARIPGHVAHFSELREKYRDSEFIQADGVKFFMDGGLYGAPRPFPEPSTLPVTGIIGEFKQPIFHAGEDGTLTLAGYVDLAGETCVNVRADFAAYQDAGRATQFAEQHGYHPAQCVKTGGHLGHNADYVNEYVRQMTEAGFHIHVHSESDLATRVLTDAFEANKETADKLGVTQTIAHAMLVHPDDAQRLGRLGVYISTTYNWMLPYPDNIAVVPFFEELTSLEDMFNPELYFIKNVFPVKSLQDAGSPLAWGSDAPQGVRDPMPFANMQAALTRELDGQVLNAKERLNIHEIIASFTIEGARLMGHDDRLGTIEAGKIADLVIINRNVVELAEQNQAHRIGETRVDLTLFNGRVIYDRLQQE